MIIFILLILFSFYLFFFISYFFLKKKKLLLTAKLAEDHSKRVTLHELKHEKTLKERQAAFGEAFEQEMKDYKDTGSIPS